MTFVTKTWYLLQLCNFIPPGSFCTHLVHKVRVTTVSESPGVWLTSVSEAKERDVAEQ